MSDYFYSLHTCIKNGIDDGLASDLDVDAYLALVVYLSYEENA